jgi:hypothetical protein
MGRLELRTQVSSSAPATTITTAGTERGPRTEDLFTPHCVELVEHLVRARATRELRPHIVAEFRRLR